MENLLLRVYNSKKTSTSLKIISHLSVLLCAVSYVLMLVHFYLQTPLLAVKLFFSLALPFVLVSLLRRIINAPRPYELYDFYKIKPKGKQGRSFPSRHLFSALAIATLSYTVSVWLAISLFFVGVSLAAARVLLGIHFLRDVLTGGIIGILSSVIGMIIIF